MECVRGGTRIRHGRGIRFARAAGISIFLWFVHGPVLAAEYTVSLLPGQTYTTLSAAESAMRNTSPTASHLQFERVKSETATERVFLYSIPDVPANPSRWSDCQNVRGEYDTAQSLCDARKTYIGWPAPLTYVETNSNGSLGNGEGFRGYCLDLTRSDTPRLGNAYYMRTCPAGYFHKNYTAIGGCANFIVGAGPYLVCGNALTATITERLGACPIRPPTPYSPDPYPLNTEKLSQPLKDALNCLDQQQGVSDARGNLAIGSAYRPSAYNLHLQDVWDRWVRELMDNTNPACQALRSEVRNHFNSHGLQPSPRARPHTHSAHTRDPAEALDLSSTLGYPELDRRAGLCQLYRNIPNDDPPHYIHR